MNNKFKPKKIFIEGYHYNDWYENAESPDKKESSDKEKSADLSDMPPLDCDVKVKEEKELMILTPSKLLTRLSKLLAQIKAGNNLCKFKNEIRKILSLLYQHIKVTEKVHDNLIYSL